MTGYLLLTGTQSHRYVGSLSTKRSPRGKTCSKKSKLTRVEEAVYPLRASDHDGMVPPR